MKRKIICAAVLAAIMLLTACGGADTSGLENTLITEEQRVEALRAEKSALEIELAALVAENSAAEGNIAELEKIWGKIELIYENRGYAVQKIVFEEFPERYSARNGDIAGYKTGAAISAEAARETLVQLFEDGDTAVTLEVDGSVLLLGISLPNMEGWTPEVVNERFLKCFSIVEKAAEELETVVLCTAALGAELFILSTPDRCNLHVDLVREDVSVQTDHYIGKLIEELRLAGVAE